MQNLTCNQVLALLTFFIENKLNKNIMQSIEYHLNICENCRERYLNLRKILYNYQEISTKINENGTELYCDNQYKIFKENLSAYIDNELDDYENYKIKKFTVSNKLARQDLEDALIFKNLLKESYNKIKDEFKIDLSTQTINLIFENNSQKPRKFQWIKSFYVMFIIMIIVYTLILSLQI